jgi:hypothetical protein
MASRGWVMRKPADFSFEVESSTADGARVALVVLLPDKG